MSLEELIESAPGGLILGWALLTIIFAMIGGIVRVITVGLKHRRLEPGRAYCANCRFDLQGGSTLACPECGSTLGKYGILAGKNRPPRSLTAKLFFVVVLITMPIAGSVALAIWGPGFNYTKTVEVDLDAWVEQDPSTYSFFNTTKASFQIRTDYGRLGGPPQYIFLYAQGPSWTWETLELGPDDAPRQVITPELFAHWDKKLGFKLDDVHPPEAVREQIIAALASLYAEQTDRSSFAEPMDVTVNETKHLNPHPLFSLLVIGLGLWAWGYTLFIIVRWHRFTTEKYDRQLQAVTNEYRRESFPSGVATRPVRD